MLYISLIISAILLFVVNLAHFRKSNPAVTAALAGVGLGIGPVVLMCFLPAVAIQATLLFFGSLVGARSERRAQHFLAYSCVVTVLIYASYGLLINNELDSLRTK